MESMGKEEEQEDLENLGENAFTKNLKQYFTDNDQNQEKLFFDFKVVSKDGSQIPCHKIILASQAQYFKGLFRQENPDSVELDFSFDIVKSCIGFLCFTWLPFLFWGCSIKNVSLIRIFKKSDEDAFPAMLSGWQAKI